MTPEDVKTIVQTNKVVVFMKGTRTFPRCGFSHRAVLCLQELGVPFTDVDVLSDATVRPALVEHSKWPTTPQVFVDGKLVGGSDIVLEMFQSGDLKKLVEPLFADSAETAS